MSLSVNDPVSGKQSSSLPQPFSANVILKKYWGYDEFRPLQHDIVTAIATGHDALALLPTGGGKSICYQVPALMQDGVCLVISPLISLMEDQVKSLKDKGIKAIAINSFMRPDAIDKALDNAIYGNIKLLYISPERIHTDLFIERFKKMKVSFVAVDESHCISQWGHEFRPAYLEISALREIRPELPILALTATATHKVIEDITSSLQLKEVKTFSQSFARTNIAFTVQSVENKTARLLDVVASQSGSGIVYVRNRRKCKEISEMLLAAGIPSSYYHAGLSHEERMKRQLNWTADQNGVIVATNAFGMGIDKANVRFVVHWDLPDSPEAFYQEAGRAGRDGLDSLSLVLYSEADIRNLWKNFYNAYPKIEVIRAVYQTLRNFFQLAVGQQPDESIPFDVNAFTTRTKLTASASWHALKTLESEGHIALSDGFYQPSRIHVSGSKIDLSTFETKYPAYKALLQFLLRAYSGILDQPVVVEEYAIRKKCNLTNSELKHQLSYLEKTGLINYFPRRSEAAVSFLNPSLTADKIVLSKGFELRKEAHLTRIRTMIDYVENKTRCRSAVILEYFGEQNNSPCGNCDVCRQKPTHLNTKELTMFSKKLVSVLKREGLMKLEPLCQLFPEFSRDQIHSACRILAEQEIIRTKPDGSYYQA